MDEMASLITSLRKEKNWTQKELAERLGVTDKAISKWETGKSYPDISLLPKIADIFGVSTDLLLSANTNSKGVEKSSMKNKRSKQLNLILKAVSLAMGVAMLVLVLLGELDQKTGSIFSSIAIICLALSALQSGNEK